MRPVNVAFIVGMEMNLSKSFIFSAFADDTHTWFPHGTKFTQIAVFRKYFVRN